jgi:hypothetical protein
MHKKGRRRRAREKDNKSAPVWLLGAVVVQASGPPALVES